MYASTSRTPSIPLGIYDPEEHRVSENACTFGHVVSSDDSYASTTIDFAPASAIHIAEVW